MQKVSKQSLAMIALSILLAISIALTFTFAAAQDTKTATGTITFSGTGALLLDGFAGTGEAGTFTITVSNGSILNYLGTENKSSLSDLKFGLASTSAPAYVKVAISVKGNNIGLGDSTKCVNATLKSNVAALGTADTIEGGSAYTCTDKQEAGKTWTVADLIDFAADSTKYVNEPDGSSKITLTVTASTNASDLQ